MAEQGEAAVDSGSLRIEILCDNTSAREHLGSEWGFAAAVRLPNGSLWLFDAGQSSLFLENGRRMGIDCRLARGLILSHGHYDHAGGIPALLRAGFTGSLHAHPDSTRSRFRIREGVPAKPIGIPQDALVLSRHLITSIPPSGRLDDGLFVLSPIPRRPALFQATSGFFLDPEGAVPDPVEDDLALLLDSSRGPVLLLGCCHSGLANTMHAAAELAGKGTIHAVLGGLHLAGAGMAAVRESAAVLEEFGVEEVFAGHCTGEQELRELAALLPGRVKPLGSGRVVEFPG